MTQTPARHSCISVASANGQPHQTDSGLGGSPAALSTAAVSFVESVVALAPRIAVFDCDGTLWAGDSGEQFLRWELKRGLLPKAVAEWIEPRYRDYQAGLVSEEDICGEMVTIHDGLCVDKLWTVAEEFFTKVMSGALFSEMIELTERLRRNGCQLWAVSSTNEWVVRAGIRRFGIPDEHNISACVHCENGVATGRLKRVPTDDDKAVAIRELIPGGVNAAFGNSIHDAAMLALAPHAFAVNPNPDLAQIARQRGWQVYFPMGTAAQQSNP